MNVALIAAAPKPHATGATAQTQAIAQAQGQANAFAAQQHPRGADGKFITTGGTVEILGNNGKPVAEGQVTGVVQTPLGPFAMVRNPTNGVTYKVPTNKLQQAPTPIATLSQKGTQGIPTGPGAAARAARWDARHGIKPRTGKDALGQQANPKLYNAYANAYKAEQVKLAKIAVRKKLAAARKSAAAAKKASKKAGGSAYQSPKSTYTTSRSYYK